MIRSGIYSKRSWFHTIDWKIVLIYLALVMIGWVNIYASIHSSEPASIFDWTCRSGKQFVWIMTSIVIAAIILFAINPRAYEVLSLYVYIAVILMLVAVIFFGVEAKGSRSWFEFGPVRFQPAEISKIATSLMLAAYMSRQGYKITRTRDFIVTAAIIVLPMLIILLQNETGSILVYVGFIFMLYREGLSGWWIVMLGMAILLFILTLVCSPFVALLVLTGVVSLCICLYTGKIKWWCLIGIPLTVLFACMPMLYRLITSDAAEGSWLFHLKPVYFLLGAVLAAIPFVLYYSFRSRHNFVAIAVGAYILGAGLVFSSDFLFNNVLQDHQRKRIEVLLGMKEDPAGVGYNVNQSMIAIGSGGLNGKGFLKGTQTTYGFVPEQSTDFIFCTIGEEWGFVGTVGVIVLYVLLILLIVRDAEQSREAFTRIYGYCVACCIFMHLFINVGMTIGLMPVIGIPLPLVSYGGSSLWAFTALIFIFIALDANEKKYF